MSIFKSAAQKKAEREARAKSVEAAIQLQLNLDDFLAELEFKASLLGYNFLITRSSDPMICNKFGLIVNVIYN